MADLSVCPSCGSELVQPLRWEELDDGRLELDLRCPECFAWMRGRFDAEDVEALDRTLRAARETLNAVHDRLVTESMEAMAECLEGALARDLLSADDFALPRRQQPEAGLEAA
jgi:hypothetical protein